MRAALLLLLGCALPALGDTLEETFDSVGTRGSATTAVWNLVRGTGHLPFFVNTNGEGGAGTSRTLDIGDGSDGPFSGETLVLFTTEGSGGERLMDTSRPYQFTTFDLPAGITLRASGSNPLVIKVQGNVSIRGTLSLDGEDGTALSADTSAAAPGGAAVAGAGAGGNGGSTGSGTVGGTSDTGNLGGGGAGSRVGANGGGGGGGGHDGAGAAGAGGGAGAAGVAHGAPLLLNLFLSSPSSVGGAGGGGGGAGDTSTGGGGGGGGGALFLAAGGTFTIESTGAVTANGGDGGGSAAAALNGGGGGGGSGGALLLVSGGVFQLDGQMLARGGSGGTVAGGGGNGGAGIAGRTRVVNSVNNFYAAGGGAVEDPVPNLGDLGRVEVDTSAPYVLASDIYDLRNTGPTMESLTLDADTPAGTSVTVEIAGSRDRFVGDDTGFLPVSSLAQLNGKRYFRFRLTLSSTDATKTPEIRSATLTYSPRSQGTFQFGIASCAAASPLGRGVEGSPLLPWLLWALQRLAQRGLSSKRPPSTNAPANSRVN